MCVNLWPVATIRTFQDYTNLVVGACMFTIALGAIKVLRAPCAKVDIVCFEMTSVVRDQLACV